MNNCQALHGIQFQSPQEIWPLAVFYQGDSRENLELNIGDGKGGPGWLNEWVENVQARSASKVFLTGDSEFEDAVCGGDLGALTNSGFNLWMNYDFSSKGDFDVRT